MADVCSGFLSSGEEMILQVGRRGSPAKDSVGSRYQNLSDIFPLGGRSSYFTDNPLG